MGKIERREVLKVTPQKNENIQRLLKRFKRLCEKEGLIRDYNRHEYYESPSERRRRKKALARRRRQKESQEQNNPTAQANSSRREESPERLSHRIR